MDQNRLGFIISIIGLIILLSAISYPLGYITSEKIFAYLIIIGNAVIFIGVLLRKK